MPIFESLTRRLSSLFTPSKSLDTKPQRQSSTASHRPRLATTKSGRTDSDTIEVSRKRKRGRPTVTENKRKKRSSEAAPDLETHEQSGLSTPPPSTSSPDLGETPTLPGDLDRSRMPPPPTPAKKQDRSPDTIKPRHSWDRLRDDMSEPSYMTGGISHRRSTDEINPDFDMELARRKAEATTLPPNSGIWAEAEKDLFYHLSMRGFEPLLPNHWMVDFKTLPLSLYERPGTGAPLIQAYDSQRDFHAIHALRDLIDLGRTVRSRIHSSRSQITSIVEKAVRKYLDWALTDADLTSRDLLPIHSIATFKKSKQTSELIDELLLNFHTVASQHHAALNLHPSVEADHPLPPPPLLNQSADDEADDANETLILETSDSDAPTLYGFMILSSVVAILTFPPHAHNPDTVRGDNSGPNANTPATIPSTTPSSPVENTGLRTIALFDFSKSGQDVWNALAIAIVVMEIRRNMLRCYRDQDGAGIRPVTKKERGERKAGQGRPNTTAAGPGDGEDGGTDDPDL